MLFKKRELIYVVLFLTCACSSSRGKPGISSRSANSVNSSTSGHGSHSTNQGGDHKGHAGNNDHSDSQSQHAHSAATRGDESKEPHAGHDGAGDHKHDHKDSPKTDNKTEGESEKVKDNLPEAFKKLGAVKQFSWPDAKKESSSESKSCADLDKYINEKGPSAEVSLVYFEGDSCNGSPLCKANHGDELVSSIAKSKDFKTFKVEASKPNFSLPADHWINKYALGQGVGANEGTPPKLVLFYKGKDYLIQDKAFPPGKPLTPDVAQETVENIIALWKPDIDKDAKPVRDEPAHIHAKGHEHSHDEPKAPPKVKPHCDDCKE